MKKYNTYYIKMDLLSKYLLHSESFQLKSKKIKRLVGLA